jgi:hypothetical protein
VRITGLCFALAIAAATLVTGEQQVQTVSFSVPAAGGNQSPAHCRIEYVTWPHPADSVPGAIKVNAKSQCDRAVEELDLSVTLFGDNMRVLKKTVNKQMNAAYIMNQDTWFMCRNHEDKHTFRGAAMGTSFEDGKPYVQFMTGAPREWPCGY